MSIQVIQEAIQQQARISFVYEYSNNESPRILKPVSIKENIVLFVDGDGKYKKFKLDGIKYAMNFDNKPTRAIRFVPAVNDFEMCGCALWEKTSGRCKHWDHTNIKLW